jgi:tetratricopeptide (TPR) repeat protein
MVRELFTANPSDFSPVSTVAAILVQKGDIEGAYELLASVADPLISQNNCGQLLEALRGVCDKAPAHIPTLELIHRICELTADELHLPEVLEALGRAHEDAGDLEKAEAAYLKLTAREPENETYLGLLKAVQHKLGKDIPVPQVSADVAMLTADVEPQEEPPPEPEVDAHQQIMVNEALENSDLFARYNLPEKAMAELEKVLQVYPDQIEVHQRILEISQKGFPARGAAAAAQLARIFGELGDAEMASRYHAIASQKGMVHATPLPPVAPVKTVEAPVAPPSPPPATPAVEKAVQVPISAVAPPAPVAAATAAPPPLDIPFDLTPLEAPSEAPAVPPPPRTPDEEIMELDLSGDLEAMAALVSEVPAPAAPVPEAAPEPAPVAPPLMETPAPAPAAVPVETPAAPAAPAPPPLAQEAAPIVETPAPVPEPPPAIIEEEIPVDLEDSKIEVDFYLENGFLDEARHTVTALEEKYPGNSFVADLRRRLDEHVGEETPAEPLELEAYVPEDEPLAAQPLAELPIADAASHPQPPQEVGQAEPAVASPPEPPPGAEDFAYEDWDLPTSYAAPAQPVPVMDPVVPPPAAAQPEAPPPAPEISAPPPAPEPVVEKPAPAAPPGPEVLGDLAGDFTSSLDGLAAPAPAFPATPVVASPGAAPPPAGPSEGAAQLRGLLAEMEESDSAPIKDDPETHYNLGVAFREMGLLDESIGEFQKVVKGAGKGNYPPNFLQACSLLAICFMEKKMPAIAVKWYLRALETPELDEEAFLALQYDLGLAYEQAGNSRDALERFTEVYSQNIDFRDVAEKIRDLQQKA